MLELIDKEAAYIALKREAEAHMLPESHEAYIRAARIIDQMKPIEAEPVRHGDWNTIYSFDGDVYFRCSNCEEEFVLDDGNPKSKGWKYCPSCGCKMDGGADNA